MRLNFNVKGSIIIDLDEEIVKSMIEEKVDINNIKEVERWIADYDVIDFNTLSVFEVFDSIGLERLELEDGEEELFKA